MVEAGKPGPMRHTQEYGKIDLDVNRAPATLGALTPRLMRSSAV